MSRTLAVLAAQKPERSAKPSMNAIARHRGTAVGGGRHRGTTVGRGRHRGTAVGGGRRQAHRKDYASMLVGGAADL